MSEGVLASQAKRRAEEIGLNEFMRSIASAVWSAFEGFLPAGSTCLARLQDVDVELVRRFIASRAQEYTDVEELLLELTCMRLTLLAAGFHHRQLSALTVRVKRERLPNDANGKYRFTKKLCNPGSCAPVAPATSPRTVPRDAATVRDIR
ncbi:MULTISPECIES: hypothetical protein [Paraburkholderia]|jgi:hypothetical protein|uniref:Uncharacterized protein n=1 Tax=Paraburkholderia kirstenboschensis TaxID=1245436 RepID=A0ABZ0EPR4_9BURK|nr:MULTISPECIES: hypothetical protein [Paraburkholderia]WOD18695.1 hypothetical protein RW095_39035 [Paraburkholderia kirstenboschensis]